MNKPVRHKLAATPAIICFLLIFSLMPGFCQTHADEIRVAAAADLQFAIHDIITSFEADTGHTVKLSLGSSGNFMNQILNGAPFDLYFSADIDFPRQLEAAGLTMPDTLFPYAVGRIVVWVRNDSAIDIQELAIHSLLHHSVRRIAIANPEHAPYGRAAVAAMRHYGLYDKLKDKLVLGENIAQAAQFVHSGNADIGIIALALVMAPALKKTGRWREIPLSAYPRMLQGAVILKGARKRGNLQAARQFADWITAPQGREVLQAYGFYMPDEQED